MVEHLPQASDAPSVAHEQYRAFQEAWSKQLSATLERCPDIAEPLSSLPSLTGDNLTNQDTAHLHAVSQINEQTLAACVQAFDGAIAQLQSEFEQTRDH